MQENKEKKENTAPNLDVIPAASLLPGWLNPLPSPTPCHCTRTLGDTLAVSLGWEETTAACPQQPPAYTASRLGTQQSRSDGARSTWPAREARGSCGQVITHRLGASMHFSRCFRIAKSKRHRKV